MAFIPGKSRTKVVPEGNGFQARYYDEEFRLWFDLGDRRDTVTDANVLIDEFNKRGVVVTTRTIPLDANTQRFYQGAAAGSKVNEEHKDVEWPSHDVRVQTWWFYVGALAAEQGCTTSDDFTHFAMGANTRKPVENED